MDNVLFAFMLTLFAGLSTTFGALLAFFTNADNKKFLSASLGFSAGVMIYISFMEMMPNALKHLLINYDEKTASLIMVAGFFVGVLIFGIIDKLVPEADNPHTMQSEEDIESLREDSLVEVRRLERMGLMSAIAVAVHNFPEGLVTFMSAVISPELGISIAIAVAIHNIPEGIAVAVPIYQATGSKKKALMMTFLSGFAEPLGALLGYLVLSSIFNDTTFGVVFAMVAGIMVFISLDELLPASREYGEAHLSIYGLFLGMLIMAISLIII